MSPALAPLRHAGFRWLFAGRSVDYLGNAVAPIALAFAVLDLTGSLTALGLIVGARSLANVALLVFGGVLADRLPRSQVLVGANLVAGLSQAAVAALVLNGTAPLPVLAGLSAVNGAAAAFVFPAASALVPQTVPAPLLQEANALGRLGLNAATAAGASLGGLLVAVVGPGWGLAVDAASFAVAAALFARVRVPRAPAAAGGGSARMLIDLREGWQEFTMRRWVWVVVAAFLFINAAWVGGITVLGPAVADETVGRFAWGIVLACQTGGMVIGGLLGLRLRLRRPLLAGMAATGLIALPLLGLALRPTLPVLLAAGFAAGLGLEQFGIAWETSLQQHIAPERLARVYSYDALGSFVAIPAGEVAVGPLAGVFGTAPTLLGLAAVILLAAAAGAADRGVRALTRPGVPPPPAR